ncbi:hypothetical protein [Mucilaginibacter glaciei]|uniref:Uncharacterized protein n=1 Tax=Mucilaginibacter glaciei TaxID=2772109 RepID=A0A926NSE0_9SPHI|nr:hypothetical protein [Mucilaginibacter glaciei]MBD1395176.1 hypothetical protein [Mucilaginibacter glaciei]
MKNESLNGTLVMVSPDLENDPAKGQGKIALVNYESLHDNEIYVAFDNGQEAVYHPDALLRLKGKEEILAELMDNGSEIRGDDYKDLYKITMLQDRGTAKAEWQALEIAQQNPRIKNAALEPAKPGIAIELQKSYSR